LRVLVMPKQRSSPKTTLGIRTGIKKAVNRKSGAIKL